MFLMSESQTNDVIGRVAEGNPSYGELVDLYVLLRSPEREDSADLVCRFALAQVVGEMLDYLDLVEVEFEKRIGLTRTKERERILGEFSIPNGDFCEQVAALIGQWNDIERYTPEDIALAIE